MRYNTDTVSSAPLEVIDGAVSCSGKKKDQMKKKEHMRLLLQRCGVWRSGRHICGWKAKELDKYDLKGVSHPHPHRLTKLMNESTTKNGISCSIGMCEVNCEDISTNQLVHRSVQLQLVWRRWIAFCNRLLESLVKWSERYRNRQTQCIARHLLAPSPFGAARPAAGCSLTALMTSVYDKLISHGAWGLVIMHIITFLPTLCLGDNMNPAAETAQFCNKDYNDDDGDGDGNKEWCRQRQRHDKQEKTHIQNYRIKLKQLIKQMSQFYKNLQVCWLALLIFRWTPDLNRGGLQMLCDSMKWNSFVFFLESFAPLRLCQFVNAPSARWRYFIKTLKVWVEMKK